MKSGVNAVNYRYGAYTTHKAEGTSWRAMKNRCLSPSYRYYHRYGGRGIHIDPRWLGRDGFKNFLADMGKKPSSKYSLDRIDNNGEYTPSNCRWATQKEQIHNSTTVVLETVDGVTDTITAHAKKYGISMSLYYKRKRAGYSAENVFKAPNNGRELLIQKRKAEHEAKIKDCLWCGKKCKHIKTKFCCGSCYMYHRNQIK